METKAEASTLAVVAGGDEVERGLTIAERRIALGMSKAEFAKRAHLDRATLERIETGAPGVRDTTLAAAERALAELDEEMGDVPDSVEEGRVVRFIVKGVHGAHSLVVEGPVEDIAELERSVDRIMRRLQDGRRDAP